MASTDRRGEGSAEETEVEAQGGGSEDGETEEEKSKEGGETKATPYCAGPG